MRTENNELVGVDLS